MIILYTYIQIIIESLPISSSGHAIFFCGKAVTPAYDYFLHGFSVLSIALYFFHDWIGIVYNWYRARFIIYRLFFTAIIADSITAVWYFLLPYTPLKQIPLWIGLLITGSALLSTYYARNKKAVIPWPARAAIIGFTQGIALIPGISRMGLTYTAARWMGMRPYRALALSLFVELPLISAGFLKGLYELYITGQLHQFCTPFWMLVYSSATIVAYGMLGATFYIAAREKMWIFGFYLLVFAGLVF